MIEFYEAGARVARRTDDLQRSDTTVGGVPAKRLDVRMATVPRRSSRGPRATTPAASRCCSAADLGDTRWPISLTASDRRRGGRLTGPASREPDASVGPMTRPRTNGRLVGPAGPLARRAPRSGDRAAAGAPGPLHHAGRPRRRAPVRRVGLGRARRRQRRRPRRAHRGRPHGEPLREGDGRGPTSTPLATSACRASRRSRAASTHGLPQPPLDDADVRGLRRGRGHERPVPGAARARARPASRSPTTCPRSTATTPTTRRPRASSGRAAWRSAASPTWRCCSTGLPLDRVSTSMTINSPAAPIWAMYIVAAEKAGVPRGRARGDDPERHPQGVRRPEGVPVPARAVDAPGHRHHRVRDARAAALEHDLDQRLPHPRGGLDRRPGAGVHDRRRHGLRRGRRWRRGLRVDDFAPRLSFFFNSHSDFFEEIAKFRASRRIWWKLMTERYRAENERSDVDALPHPDRGRLADPAAAAQQPDPGRDPGARGGARWDAVAPYRRLRRGARGADRRGRPARPPPAADHRRGDRRRVDRSIRSAERGSSRR